MLDIRLTSLPPHLQKAIVDMENMFVEQFFFDNEKIEDIRDCEYFDTMFRMYELCTMVSRYLRNEKRLNNETK